MSKCQPTAVPQPTDREGGLESRPGAQDPIRHKTDVCPRRTRVKRSYLYTWYQLGSRLVCYLRELSSFTAACSRPLLATLRPALPNSQALRVIVVGELARRPGSARRAPGVALAGTLPPEHKCQPRRQVQRSGLPGPPLLVVRTTWLLCKSSLQCCRQCCRRYSLHETVSSEHTKPNTTPGIPTHPSRSPAAARSR